MIKLPKTIIVNGAARSGKDTFCEYAIVYLASKKKFSTNISSVDIVKQASKILGFDGIKDEKGRQSLSDLKEISTRYNGPMKYMSDHIDNGGSDVVFVHIREPDEIEKFVKCYPDTITILLKRDGIEKYYNDSDDNVDDYSYDNIIYNKGTKEDLKQNAIDLVDYIISS